MSLTRNRNLALSLAAGNATLWKPSPSTPLCSIAVTRIVAGVLEKNGIPGAVAGLVIGGKSVGEAVVESRDVDMGKHKGWFTAIYRFHIHSFLHRERIRRTAGRQSGAKPLR